jgi:hypothetical protein
LIQDLLRIAQLQKMITREQFATLFQSLINTQKIELDALAMASLLNGSQITEFLQEIVYNRSITFVNASRSASIISRLKT